MVNSLSGLAPHAGDISRPALSYAAGPGFDETCDRIGNITDNKIVETDGFNLACKKLYHISLLDWCESSTSVSGNGMHVLISG